MPEEKATPSGPQLALRIVFVLFSAGISIVWFSLVLPSWGEQWKLKEPQSGAFTEAGVWWTIGVIAVFLLASVGNIVYTWRNERRSLETHRLAGSAYLRLLNSMRAICHRKYGVLSDYVAARSESGAPFPEVCTEPVPLIKEIVRELGEFVRESAVTKIIPDNLSASIAYRIHGGGWEWVDNAYGEIGSELETLSREPTSTFYEVSYKPTTGRVFKFYNSKDEAERDRHYFKDERDNAGDGSIVCVYIGCKAKDKILIEAILSISTYGTRIVPGNEEKRVRSFRESLRDRIFPEYESRLRHELLLFYMEKVNERRGT